MSRSSSSPPYCCVCLKKYGRSRAHMGGGGGVRQGLERKREVRISGKEERQQVGSWLSGVMLMERFRDEFLLGVLSCSRVPGT